jgi:RND family efflux transporter MFP subunit
MKKNQIIIIVSAVIILSLGIFGFKKLNSNSQNFQTFEVKKQDIQLSVKVNGKVEADKKSDLSFNVIGKINYLPFKKGDTVKKGQRVASIDSKIASLEKDLALKDYLTTRWNFEQSRQDNNVNGTPLDQNILTDAQKRTLEESQFSLDQSVAKVEISNQQLSDSSIYAPFDGVISEVNGEIGSIAGPSIPTVTVSQVGKLKITANVSEAQIIDIKKNNQVDLFFDALPNQKFIGKVDKIDSTENIVSGVVYYQVTILSDNIPSEILSGMSVTCTIKTEKKDNVLVIPIRLIENYENDKGKLTILENKKPVKKDIIFGIRGDGAVVEINSGAKEGDLIVDQKI